MKKLFLLLALSTIIGFVPSYAQTDGFNGICSGTNTYAVTIGAYTNTSYVNALKLSLKFTNANTGASTINVNSRGAKAVTISGAALTGGEIPSGVYISFIYDAASQKFQMQPYSPGGGGAAGWKLTGNAVGADTKFLGSTDNFNVGFKTNNTVRETILKGGQHVWGTGTTLSGTETYSFQGGDVYVDDNFLVNNFVNSSTRTIFGGLLTVQGATADDTEFALKVNSVTPATLFGVRNDGRVGIGTTSPEQKIDVRGDIAVSNGTEGVGIYTSGTVGFIAGVDPTRGVAFNDLNLLTGNTSVLFQPDGTMNFQSYSGSKIFIQPDGDIGINQNSPTAKLHIVSTSAVTPLFQVDSGAISKFRIHPYGQIELGFHENIFLGITSGLNATSTAEENIGIGEDALELISTGDDNISIGRGAQRSNLASGHNISIGSGALSVFVGTEFSGENISIGVQSAASLTSGNGNVFIGHQSGISAVSSAENVFVGSNSGAGAGNKYYNVGIGHYSLAGGTSGTGNSANGYYTGNTATTASNCSYFGYQAGRYNNTSFLSFFGTRDYGSTALELIRTPLVIYNGTDSSNTTIGLHGAVTITDGTQGANKVFTSDASGVGSWQNPAISAVYSNSVTVTPNIIIWNDSAQVTTGVATFFPTSDGTATGTALFTNIYSIQATASLNTSTATAVSLAGVKTIAANKKTITVNAVDGVVLAALGATMEFSPDGTYVYLTIIGK